MVEGRAIEFDNAMLVLGVLDRGPANPAPSWPGQLMRSRTEQSVTNTPFVAGMASMALLAVGALAALLAQIEPILEFIAEVSNSEIDVRSALRLADSSFHEGIRGLILGAVLLGIVSSVHHWGHKIWGRSMDDKMGMLTVLLVVVGSIAWVAPTSSAGFWNSLHFPASASDQKMELNSSTWCPQSASRYSAWEPSCSLPTWPAQPLGPGQHMRLGLASHWSGAHLRRHRLATLLRTDHGVIDRHGRSEPSHDEQSRGSLMTDITVFNTLPETVAAPEPARPRLLVIGTALAAMRPPWVWLACLVSMCKAGLK